MNRILVLAACFVSAPALASSHVIEFNILACPTVPSNIGFMYSSPNGHTDWYVNGTERFYAACSHFNSPSLAIDGPGNDVSYTIENTTSDVLLPTQMLIEGAPGPLGPLVESVTFRRGSQTLVFNLMNGPVFADLSSLRGLRPGETLIVEADGALLFDDFSYELESDRDNDGYVPAEGDCDDLNPTVNPGATDIIGDGIDQDCDGADAQSTLPFKGVVAMPSCRSGGPLHIVWSGGTPNGQVQILPGQRGSSPSVWNGPSCAGRLLGLTPVATPPPVTNGNAGTGFFVVPSAGAGVCGFRVQLLDLDSCAVTELMVVE